MPRGLSNLPEGQSSRGKGERLQLCLLPWLRRSNQRHPSLTVDSCLPFDGVRDFRVARKRHYGSHVNQCSDWNFLLRLLLGTISRSTWPTCDNTWNHNHFSNQWLLRSICKRLKVHTDIFGRLFPYFHSFWLNKLLQLQERSPNAQRSN